MWREAVALHHVTGLEFLQTGQEWLLVKTQPRSLSEPQNIEHASIVGQI